LLQDIQDYLQTRMSVEAAEVSWVRTISDPFNRKMILLGSAAMALSMLSGNYINKDVYRPEARF
jgi:hypothetical protein